MEDKKSILMSGYYGFDNSGDDAILKAIVKDIRNIRKDIEITVLSNNPHKTKEMYDVKAVNRFSLSEVFGAIRSTSLLVSGGGSLLQDVTSNRSLWYYLAVMTLAKIFGKPVMVYANGVGPISGGFNRFLTKLVLNGADIITLRDGNSKKYIENIGVSNKEVYVTADPVFTLEPVSRDIVLDIFKKEGIKDRNKLIGVSVREWKKAENLEENISIVIDEMIEKYDANVLLIPMHYPEDLVFSEKVLSLLKNKGAYILKDKYSVEEIMGVIRELDMIIAMRLHSLIYAATQSIPMVGLVYDPKVVGILESIDMKFMTDVEALDVNTLLSDIDTVWSDKENIKIELNSQEQKLKDMALRNIDLVCEILR